MADHGLDSLGMWAETEGLPEQVEHAVGRARQLVGLPAADHIEAVVVLGMGDSGMAGDILEAVAAPFMPVPVSVVRSYECPAFVGDTTLVFAISASGETEETLQAAGDAAIAGASLVVVTGGGQLARLAGGWDAAVIEVPHEIPQSRAALGALAVPPLVVLEQIGLFPGGSNWIDAAISGLKRRRDALVAGPGESLAAGVARRIGRTIPVIEGGGAVGTAAAKRWKTQINENAKSPAWWSSQPEASHNEICGWGQHGDVTRQVCSAVCLRHDGEHPQVTRRMDAVAELMLEVVADVITVRAEGDGDLAQLLDLILVGDFVSLWMAEEAGVDPGPVPVLADLERLITS